MEYFDIINDLAYTEGPFAEVTFDIKTNGTVDPEDVLNDVEDVLGMAYDIIENTHETVGSSKSEYAHVRLKIAVDEEEDIEIINYLIRGVPVANFEDIDIEILNIEHEFIPRDDEALESDAEITDDDELEITNDEGLYSIDDEEDTDGEIELQEW